MDGQIYKYFPKKRTYGEMFDVTLFIAIRGTIFVEIFFLCIPLKRNICKNVRPAGKSGRKSVMAAGDWGHP